LKPATIHTPSPDELAEKYTGTERASVLFAVLETCWIELSQEREYSVACYYVDPEVLDDFEYELEYGKKGDCAG